MRFWTYPPWCFAFLQKDVFEQLSNFPTPNPSKQPFSFFRHKWEDGSRTVSMVAFNFSTTPWCLWHVMNQAVRKPCFPISIPRGQNPRFLNSHISKSPGEPGRAWWRYRPLEWHYPISFLNCRTPQASLVGEKMHCDMITCFRTDVLNNVQSLWKCNCVRVGITNCASLMSTV